MRELFAILALFALGTSTHGQTIAYEGRDFWTMDAPIEQSGDGVNEQGIGEDNSELVGNYGPTSFERQLSSPIARLRIRYSHDGEQKVTSCTGFAITRNHILTNRHCYHLRPPGGGHATANQILADFGYLRRGSASVDIYGIIMEPVEIGGQDQVFDDYAMSVVR